MIVWPVKFTESKYSKWYERLVEKAQSRGTIVGYKETHHIVPRSFGGSDSKSNLVHLTAREHYVAHALLWKMKFDGVYGSKMAFAFNTFISKMQTEERGVHHTYKINSRMYETFRKEYSRLLKEKYAREGGTFTGRKHTEETKRKIGEKSKLKEFKRGPENPNWGKKQNVSPEGKAARREAVQARWADPEFKKAMKAKRKAFLETPEGKALIKKQSDLRRGIKRDPAIIEKMAVTKRGKTWEELYTPEQIERMKAGIKNRVLSPEAKAKMSFKGKGKGVPKVKKPCPHCGKLCAGNMLAKWHGPNCKEQRDDHNLSMSR